MSEITDLGILAYRNGHYLEAITFLLCATKDNPANWLAWLYLAQAYDKRKMIPQAVRAFVHVAVECPDPAISNKAEAHLLKLESVMMDQFGESLDATKPDGDRLSLAT